MVIWLISISIYSSSLRILPISRSTFFFLFFFFVYFSYFFFLSKLKGKKNLFSQLKKYIYKLKKKKKKKRRKRQSQKKLKQTKIKTEHHRT